MSKIELINNLTKIKENIDKAARKSGRSFEDITLIGVTKTIDPHRMDEAIALGIRDIGESKVQEIQRKMPLIHKGQDVNWHMIGHLQSNKVKYIIDKVHMIHSLDRLSLAKELQKRASALEIDVQALVQVNIAEEDSKFGLKRDDVVKFLEEIVKLNRIKIKGLMTLAPYSDNPEKVRYVFRDLKKLSEEIASKNFENVDMTYLSMGMTNDYQVAIEEGANMVRVGTGLFGKREYKEVNNG